MASTLTGTNHEFEKVVVETQLYLLVRFARSLGAYRAVHQDFAKVGNNEQFWIQTADSNFLRAVTEWCMVFGVDNNETHWKNAVRTEPSEFNQAVRNVITAAGGFTQPQWEAYHADVRNFRDTYASHRQLVVTGNVPDMTLCWRSRKPISNG